MLESITHVKETLLFHKKKSKRRENIRIVYTGLAIGGPVGLAPRAITVGGIVAYEFERKMWKRIQETVKKVSQVQPTLESVDTYHH